MSVEQTQMLPQYTPFLTTSAVFFSVLCHIQLALLADATSPLFSSAPEELNYCTISTLAGSTLCIGYHQILYPDHHFSK